MMWSSGPHRANTDPLKNTDHVDAHCSILIYALAEPFIDCVKTAEKLIAWDYDLPLPSFIVRLVAHTTSRHPMTSLTARPALLLRELMPAYNKPPHGKQYKDAECSLPPIPTCMYLIELVSISREPRFADA